MIRTRTLLAAGFLALSAGTACPAHELKVLLSHLVANLGDRDTAYISWGHVLPVDLPIDGETLSQYELQTPSGSVMYLNKDGVSLHANEFHVEEEGIYQAVAARKPSTYTIVVDEHGNHEHKPGPRSANAGEEIDRAFRSHQFAKALMISGTAPEEAVKPLGHLLEIVPLDEPGEWKSGRLLRFQVLFQGKPLPHQDLKATYIGFKPDEAWCYAATTDSKGTVPVQPSRPGTWVLRMNLREPTEGETREQYDEETYTATLVLEIQP